MLRATAESPQKEPSKRAKAHRKWEITENEKDGESGRNRGELRRDQTRPGTDNVNAKVPFARFLQGYVCLHNHFGLVKNLVKLGKLSQIFNDFSTAQVSANTKYLVSGKIHVLLNLGNCPNP